MSAISISKPPQASITGEPPKEVKNSNAMPLSAYRIATPQEDALRKSLLRASLNARAKVWAPRDLSIYSKSVYFYAIFRISLSLYWNKGGREIAASEPSSMIFASLTHCPSTTDINNYFFMADGRRFSLDKRVKCLVRLSPLGASPDDNSGPNSRLAFGRVAKTFYLSPDSH